MVRRPARRARLRGTHGVRSEGEYGEAGVVETVAAAVALPSGLAYYLFEGFNHHHQHAVMGNEEEGGWNGGADIKTGRHHHH